MGVQVRYTQKLNKIRMDGGLGIAGGDRSSRMFVGADYEIFLTMKSSRVSVN